MFIALIRPSRANRLPGFFSADCGDKMIPQLSSLFTGECSRGHCTYYTPLAIKKMAISIKWGIDPLFSPWWPVWGKALAAKTLIPSHLLLKEHVKDYSLFNAFVYFTIQSYSKIFTTGFSSHWSRLGTNIKKQNLMWNTSIFLINLKRISHQCYSIRVLFYTFVLHLLSCLLVYLFLRSLYCCGNSPC